MICESSNCIFLNNSAFSSATAIYLWPCKLSTISLSGARYKKFCHFMMSRDPSKYEWWSSAKKMLKIRRFKDTFWNVLTMLKIYSMYATKTIDFQYCQYFSEYSLRMLRLRVLRIRRFVCNNIISYISTFDHRQLS